MTPISCIFEIMLWKTMSYSVGAHPFIITLYCFTLKWSWVVKFIPCDENWLFGWKSWWGKVQSIRISSLVDLSDNWSNFEFVIYLQCYKDFQDYFSLEVSLELKMHKKIDWVVIVSPMINFRSRLIWAHFLFGWWCGTFYSTCTNKWLRIWTFNRWYTCACWSPFVPFLCIWCILLSGLLNQFFQVDTNRIQLLVVVNIIFWPFLSSQIQTW